MGGQGERVGVGVLLHGQGSKKKEIHTVIKAAMETEVGGGADLPTPLQGTKPVHPLPIVFRAVLLWKDQKVLHSAECKATSPQQLYRLIMWMRQCI